MKIFNEWFWSRASAERAASRMKAKGFTPKVRHAMRANGSNDWLLEVFA